MINGLWWFGLFLLTALFFSTYTRSKDANVVLMVISAVCLVATISLDLFGFGVFFGLWPLAWPWPTWPR